MPAASRIPDAVAELVDWDQQSFVDGQSVAWDAAAGMFHGGGDGLVSLADAAARDALPSARRREGMIAYTRADGVYWILGRAPWSHTAADWTSPSLPDPVGHAGQLLGSDGTGYTLQPAVAVAAGTGDGLVSLADVAARDALADTRRQEGMIVYTRADGVYWILGRAPWAHTAADWASPSLPDPAGHAGQLLGSDGTGYTLQLAAGDGLVSLADVAARDALADARRQEGMIAYTRADGVYWILGRAPWAHTAADWTSPGLPDPTGHDGQSLSSDGVGYTLRPAGVDGGNY